MHPALEQLMLLLNGGDSNAPFGIIALRGSLIVCSLLASVQVLSMLVTQWGEKNAGLKSLFGSLLLHVCLGLAWATVAESMGPAIPGPLVEPPESRQQVVLVDDDAAPVDSAGNTASLPQLSPPQLTQLDRLTRTADEAPLPEIPSLDAPRPLETSEVAPLAAMNNEVVEAPVAIAAETAASRSVAPSTLATPPDPTTAARSEASTALRQRSAKITTRNPEAADASTDLTPLVGASERTSPELQFESLSIPTEGTEGEPLPAAKTPQDRVARRAAPAGTLGVAETAGSQAPAGPTAAASMASGSRFQRKSANRQSRPDSNDAMLESPGRQVASTSTRANASLGSLSGNDVSPADELPGPVRPDLPAMRQRQSARTPATYRLRRLEQRKEIALKNGGTEESEKVVEASLKWLADNQEPAGHWDAGRFGGGVSKRSPEDPADLQDRRGSGTEADTGVTGLAVLAFLGAGYTHEEGQYAEVVEKALREMIRLQRFDGYMGGPATYYDAMYCHAIATYAMAEAYGMQNDAQTFPELKAAVAKAAGFIVALQNKDGGWRYTRGMQESDMSMFGWQLMALKSAEIAGLEIPAETRTGMLSFLKDRSRGEQGGLAGYRASDAPTPAMTAESLFCKQMFGIRRTNAASQEAARYLQKNLPRMSLPNDYYWYYGTLAMFQYGGEPWNEWNGSMRDTLIKTQRRTGDLAGSWDPQDPWGGIGGRVYSTALSTLCLEVYYRFLPLYRLGDFEGE